MSLINFEVEIFKACEKRPMCNYPYGEELGSFRKNYMKWQRNLQFHHKTLVKG